MNHMDLLTGYVDISSLMVLQVQIIECLKSKIILIFQSIIYIYFNFVIKIKYFISMEEVVL